MWRMSSETDEIRPLLQTRQYREFTSEPVSDEALDALVRVARWSGSSGNSQPWRFIVVRDVDLLRRIAEIAMPQTRGLRTAMAAIAITLPDERDHAVSYAYDEGRVAERILVAASMLGLGAGIGWILSAHREPVERELGVPDGRLVRTIMAIGHPAESARRPRAEPGKARLPVEELVSWR
jgi:nitroreductase